MSVTATNRSTGSVGGNTGGHFTESFWVSLLKAIPTENHYMGTIYEYETRKSSAGIKSNPRDQLEDRKPYENGDGAE